MSRKEYFTENQNETTQQKHTPFQYTCTIGFPAAATYFEALGAFVPPELGDKLIDGIVLGMLDRDGTDDGIALTLGPNEGSLEGPELGMELTLGSRLGSSEGLVDGSRETDGVIEGPSDGDDDGT